MPGNPSILLLSLGLLTSSLQLEHEPLTKAGKGQQVGFKLETGKEVQVGDEVFLAKE